MNFKRPVWLTLAFCATLNCAAFSQQIDLMTLSDRIGHQLTKSWSLNNPWQEGAEALYALSGKEGSVYIYNAKKDVFWPAPYDKVILPNMGYSPSSFTLKTAEGMWEVYAENPADASKPWSRLGEIPASDADSIAMTNFGEYLVFSGNNLSFLQMKNGRLQQTAVLDGCRLLHHVPGEMIFTKSLASTGASIQLRSTSDGKLLSQVAIDSVLVYPTTFSDYAVIKTQGLIKVWNAKSDSVALEHVTKAEAAPLYEFPIVWGDGFMAVAGNKWLWLPIDEVVDVEYQFFGDLVKADIYTAAMEKVEIDLWSASVIKRGLVQPDTFVFKSVALAKKFPSSVKHLEVMQAEKDGFDALLPQLSVLESLTIKDRSLAALPEDVCTLKGLKYLDISQTSISELPICFAALGQLETLNMSGLVLLFSPEVLKPLQKLSALHVSAYDNPGFSAKAIKTILPNCKVID